MNSDIRIEIGFTCHRKTRRLIKTLGPESIVALITLWEYAAVNEPDGRLRDHSPQDIARCADWPESDAERFVQTLVEIGLLDHVKPPRGRPCGGLRELKIHDWEEHQPYVVDAKKRSRAASEAARSRWDVSRKQQVNAQRISHPHKPTAQALRNAETENPHDAPSLPTLPTNPEDQDQPPLPPNRSAATRFPEFWAIQVHRQSRPECEEIWKRMRLDGNANQVIAAYKAQLKWPEYQGDRIQFLKRPASWLRKKRWLDEPQPNGNGAAYVGGLPQRPATELDKPAGSGFDCPCGEHPATREELLEHTNAGHFRQGAAHAE